jgi:hypothetical protein
LILLFIALLIVKCAVSLHIWLPVYNLPSFYRATPEFLFILLLLGLASKLRRKSWLLLGATFFCCILFVLSLGEGITQYLYRRSLNPLLDFSFFPEFIRLLFESKRGFAIVLYAAGFCAVIGLIFVGIFYLLRATVRMLGRSRYPVPLFWIIFAVFLITWAVPGGSSEPEDMLVLRIARSMAGDGEDLEVSGEDEERSAVEEEIRPYRNVLLFIVESYGFTAFAKEDHWLILKPHFEEFHRRIAGSGYRVFSNFLRSPVIGGYSWYADSTLLTGIRIDAEQEYQELLQSDTPTIVSILNSMDYRTVLAAPGTLRPWPEGEMFYSFDHTMYNVDFDYRGPEFSFVPCPDQYSLYRVHNRFLAVAGDAPIFIEYMLVSSHAPFNRIPPYVHDWNTLGNGSVYHELPVLTFRNNWFQGKEYTEGYTEAIRYVLDVITSYLVQFIDDDTLIIITGDHQPKYPVTERGQPLSVPVHLLCRDRELLDPLVEIGYIEGLVPTQPPPHEGLEQFFSHFMALLPDL